MHIVPWGADKTSATYFRCSFLATRISEMRTPSGHKVMLDIMFCSILLLQIKKGAGKHAVCMFCDKRRHFQSKQDT